MELEKRAAKELLTASQMELARMTIMEKYLSFRALEGSPHIGKALQMTQFEIAEKKKLVDYLTSHYA